MVEDHPRKLYDLTGGIVKDRVGHSAENFSRIRRLALNLLRQDKSGKAGIKEKRLKACLEESYLLGLLARVI